MVGNFVLQIRMKHIRKSLIMSQIFDEDEVEPKEWKTAEELFPTWIIVIKSYYQDMKKIKLPPNLGVGFKRCVVGEAYGFDRSYAGETPEDPKCMLYQYGDEIYQHTDGLAPPIHMALTRP